MFKKALTWIHQQLVVPISRIFRSKRDILLEEIAVLLPKLSEAALDTLITFILLNIDTISGELRTGLMSQRLKGVSTANRRAVLLEELRLLPEPLLEDVRVKAEVLLNDA